MKDTSTLIKLNVSPEVAKAIDSVRYRLIPKFHTAEEHACLDCGHIRIEEIKDCPFCNINMALEPLFLPRIQVPMRCEGLFDVSFSLFMVMNRNLGIPEIDWR